MGNVVMGKFLKTLPIMVFNIWVNILPMGYPLGFFLKNGVKWDAMV